MKIDIIKNASVRCWGMLVLISLMITIGNENLNAQPMEVAKLQASDKQTGARFGISVSISGQRAIIGAAGEESGAGAAYIFERDGSGTWSEVAKLQASDKAVGDQFGYSVSISGERVIAGASNEDTGGIRTGAAYIFERDGSGSWSEVTKVQASDKEAEDRFGRSVSISGERAIVGTIFEDTGGSDAGAAYIFERDGSGRWSEVAKLQASDKEAVDLFGWSVCISGERAIVGAILEDTGGGDVGAAYIFERDGSGTWSEVVKVQASDKAVRDQFGWSVSINGERAIVGAYLEDTGGNDAGAAYIFERDGSGTWSEVAKVQAGDKAAQDWFGHSVSISGERAIVGAVLEDTGGISAGAAYIFERDGSGTWSEVAKMQASDKAAEDYFGHSVSISGERLIAGASGEDTGGSNAGAVYIFESTPQDKIDRLIADVKALETAGVLIFGQANSLTSKLKSVKAKLDEGKTRPALNQLNAFTNEVNSLIAKGVLAPGEGQLLIDAANIIIDQISTALAKQSGAVDEAVSALPEDILLKQNYPNPFNPTTEIEFAISRGPVTVSLKIYDITGQEIRSLMNETVGVGQYRVSWDGMDNAGNLVAAGIYLYQLRAGEYLQTRKMTLVK